MNSRAQRRDLHRIGLLGAESSGKTTLAVALVSELNNRGIPAVLVPEYLRTWCEQSGRLPTIEDQAEILRGQIAAEDTTARAHPDAVLVCDPAAITTPLYSQLYFGKAINIETELLRRYQRLIWCNIDIDWSPDPLRDSPVMRERMHDLITGYMPAWEGIHGGLIPLVSGSVEERLRQAWQPGLPNISP